MVRGPRRPFVVAALLASGVCLLAGPTDAQEEGEAAEPITLDVEVVEGCPGDVAAQVLARTARARIAGAGEPGRRFAIRIERSGDRFVGTLAIETEITRSERQVAAPRCDEVVSALALIAALAVDAAARRDVAPAEEPVPPEPPSPAPLAVDVSPPADDRPASPAAAREDGSPVRPSIGLGVGVTSALAPGPMPGGLLMLELGVPRAEPLWLFRASAGAWSSGAIALENGNATFDAVLARIDACVVPLRAQPLWVAPCATFDVGSLQAEGEVGGRIVAGSQRAQPWAAPGLATRLGVDVVGPMAIALEAAATVPLRRDSFVFETPAEVVHQPDVVAIRGGLDVSVHIR